MYKLIVLFAVNLIAFSSLACDCSGPFYFLENLKYEYVCHIKVIKHYKSENNNGTFNGLTKFVVLNSPKIDQINDTLFYVNSSPSLCGQTIGNYSEGEELVIKANLNNDFHFIMDFDYFKLPFANEVLNDNSFILYKNNQMDLFNVEFKYSTVSSSSCDRVILGVKGNVAMGMIGEKQASTKYKYYKFLSLFSQKYKNMSLDIKLENQKMKFKNLKKMLKFKLV